MNFLRHSFSSISDPPSLHSDSDREAPPRAPPATPPPPPTFDSDSEDARFAPPAAASAVDSLRTKNRVAIEDHVDVPEERGGILVPSRELPSDWHMGGEMTSVMGLDRSFVFPGERLSIVVYVSSHDASMPEIITPFRVAAMMDKANLTREKNDKENASASFHESSEASDKGEEKQHTPAAEVESCPPYVNMYPVSETLLRLEGHKKRSAALLLLFQNSHFFTRISRLEEQVWKKRTAFNQPSEELDDGTAATNSSEHKKSTESDEPVPIHIEGGDFDPRNAGGVARNARCYVFDNGDIAVVLQITVGTDLKHDVVLEVLQFEQPWKLGGIREETTSFQQSYSNSSEHLLQWLLPLDNPLIPPLPTMPATPSSFVNSSPQKPSLTGSSGSTLFSFANPRTYSTGSSSQSIQTLITSTSPQLPSTHGSDEWDRPAGLKISKGQCVGNEGLLSFRGVHLEPQRFSVHYGLEGLYVPGWRWRRKLEIVEPVAIESYFADCNTKDLICVCVENVVPDHLSEILVIVDSISIVCQTSDPSSIPSSVPIACVEVGENHKLPGLTLRRGEQHSFILKPSNSPLRSSVTDTAKVGSASTSYGYDLQTSKVSYYSLAGNGKKKAKEHKPGSSSQDAGNYVLVVSCRCSHTESRLHFKHPIKWQPRTPRDLLLSVSLEPVPIPEMPTGSLPSLLPKVVTVQATNLTSECLHLTLLAPSLRYPGSSLTAPVMATPGLSRISSFMDFHERKEWPIAKAKENDLELERTSSEASPSMRPGSLQRSMSLPPVRPIESIMGITPRVVKERAISAADIAAENSSARTHLWLQSIVPLGSVPPQATTAIRCELLPLTDGIITLDTLHISTKQRDVYYPERPLQIHATSSIGIGIP